MAGTVAAGLIRLVRPKHWVKNALVLVPAVFSGQLFERVVWLPSLLACLSFCLVASSVYVLNDLRDVERNRANPVKRSRPIASGQVPVAAAMTLFALLLGAAVLLQLAVGSASAALILAVYLALNIAYSMGFKHVPILDVCILAAGYVLRIYYGGAACGIHVSSWLCLTVLSASFYMGLGKRRGELVTVGITSRPVLKSYGEGFLDKNMYMFLGLANAFFALWAREAVPGMVMAVPLVMVLSMRYSLDIESASDGDPMEIVLSDPWLMALAGLLAIVLALVLYVAPLWR